MRRARAQRALTPGKTIAFIVASARTLVWHWAVRLEDGVQSTTVRRANLNPKTGTVLCACTPTDMTTNLCRILLCPKVNVVVIRPEAWIQQSLSMASAVYPDSQGVSPTCHLPKKQCLDKKPGLAAPLAPLITPPPSRPHHLKKSGSCSPKPHSFPHSNHQ